MWVILLTVFTLQDIRDAECNTGCRYHGYDSGKYKDKICLCTDEFSYERITGKKVTLPKKEVTTSESTNAGGWSY